MHRYIDTSPFLNFCLFDRSHSPFCIDLYEIQYLIKEYETNVRACDFLVSIYLFLLVAISKVDHSLFINFNTNPVSVPTKKPVFAGPYLATRQRYQMWKIKGEILFSSYYNNNNNTCEKIFKNNWVLKVILKICTSVSCLFKWIQWLWSCLILRLFQEKL